jgi:hypothetical protein
MSENTQQSKELTGTQSSPIFHQFQQESTPAGGGNNAMVQLNVMSVNLRFTMFFDGTMNNKHNTKINRENGTNHGDSYTNDYSNVAKMYDYLTSSTQEYNHHFAIYTEGIGTCDGKSDSTVVGGGLGAGDYGITQKVSDARSRIIKVIKDHHFLSIDKCAFDVIGFSRGAAAARYFVSQLGTLNNLLKFQKLPEAKMILVNFVGLFDTVASHWFYHKNDPKDLCLDAVKGALSVVQLAAADEYRENFSLTNIKSAVDKGVGIEITLPGAHSDIGGGYCDNDDEIDLQVLDIDAFTGINDAQAKKRFDEIRALYMNEGWYTNCDIAKKENWWNELKASRSGIKNAYSLIPLEIMIHHAQKCGLTFDTSKIEAALKKEAMSTVRPEIRHRVSQENWDVMLNSYMNAQKSSEEFDCMEKMAFWTLKERLGTNGRGNWKTDDIVRKVLPLVRHRYFHNSSRFDGVGMDTRFVNAKGETDLMKGTRKRLIMRG